jgi:calcium-dependent protein kinase
MNFIHRDIKPDNILINDANDLNSIIVADFGLASNINDEHANLKRCGTPGYMAPEILNKVEKNLKK